MTWCGIEGHDRVAELFRQSLAAGRLASTFLFVGPPGVGKRLFAGRLSQGLLCERRPESDLAPCRACDACLQIEAGTHPDVSTVHKPADRSVLPVDLFIGDLEHRGREGLCRWISLKPLRGRRRVAIINDADYFNEASANCLLKTLEEPPANSVLILIGTSAQRQLPTIRSRCQIIRFRPLNHDFVRRKVLEQGITDSEESAADLASLSEGSLELAAEFGNEKLAEFRQQLWSQLVDQKSTDSVGLAVAVKEFVDAAGKEAGKRRERLRHAIWLFMIFYRQIIFLENGAPVPVGGVAAEMAQRCCDQLHGTPPMYVEQRLERCLNALQELNANANIATLIECWIDDL